MGMSEKNTLDTTAQVGPLQRSIKHYLVQGDPRSWFDTLCQLTTVISIPRAIIFCDNDSHFNEVKRRLMSPDKASIKCCIVESFSQLQASLANFAVGQYDFML